MVTVMYVYFKTIKKMDWKNNVYKPGYNYVKVNMDQKEHRQVPTSVKLKWDFTDVEQ